MNKYLNYFRSIMKDQWGDVAEAYSKTDKINGFFCQKAVDILHMDRLRPGAQILDVACGPGPFGIRAAQKLAHLNLVDANTRIFMTDFSEPMLKQAQRWIQQSPPLPSMMENIRVQVMDGQQLEFPDDSMDRIGCMYGIMFMPDYKKSLLEMKRVLKPGGFIVIGTWKTLGVLELYKAFSYATQIVPEGYIPPMAKCIDIGSTKEAMIRDCEDAGFKNVQVQVFSTLGEVDNSIDAEKAIRGALLNPVLNGFLMSPGKSQLSDQETNHLVQSFLSFIKSSDEFRHGNGGYKAQFISLLTVAEA
jgi:ubiquinone/menaquinone biosynthesis C-methylase UbiE